MAVVMLSCDWLPGTGEMTVLFWSTVSVKRRSWSWQQYLTEQKAEAAPSTLFTQVRNTESRWPLPLHIQVYPTCSDLFVSQDQSVPSRRTGFKVGMKLEGVDPLHPSMFCVLTVAEVTA